jgi:hypothetical protein
MQPRAFGMGGHHDERALQRLGIASELHGRRVREMLATTRDRRLEQSPGDHADAARDEDRERDDLEPCRILAAPA